MAQVKMTSSKASLIKYRLGKILRYVDESHKVHGLSILDGNFMFTQEIARRAARLGALQLSKSAHGKYLVKIKRVCRLLRFVICECNDCFPSFVSGAKVRNNSMDRTMKRNSENVLWKNVYEKVPRKCIMKNNYAKVLWKGTMKTNEEKVPGLRTTEK